MPDHPAFVSIFLTLAHYMEIKTTGNIVIAHVTSKQTELATKHCRIGGPQQNRFQKKTKS